jgi:tight adherence protein C
MVDLLLVAAGAGLTVFRSLEVVAEAGPLILRAEVQRVVDGVRCGRPLRAGLDDLAHRMPIEEMAALSRALAATHLRGTPLADGVAQVGAQSRARLRQEAEANARTAPVKMLFPLAFLILPSFLLLAAAPPLVTAFRQLRL